MRILQKTAQSLGFLMLLGTTALSTANATYLIIWLGVAVMFLYLGKSFSFQHKR